MNSIKTEKHRADQNLCQDPYLEEFLLPRITLPITTIWKQEDTPSKEI